MRYLFFLAVRNKADKSRRQVGQLLEIIDRLVGQVSWVHVRPHVQGRASTPIPETESHQRASPFAVYKRRRVGLD
jgi:hypothetical protein